MDKLKLGFISGVAVCMVGVFLRYVFGLDSAATIVTGIGFVVLVVVATAWLINAKKESRQIAAQRKAERLDEEEE